jgi:transposase InsO family protein
VHFWLARWRTDRLTVQPRGRPLAETPSEQRREVLAVLGLLGAAVGVATLRAIFPAIARAELVDLAERYRRLAGRERIRLVHALRWERTGAVWAADFTDPPAPIDGVYPKVLLIRELAAGRTLFALPCPDESARHVRGALVALIAHCGAPLVFKSDNGSAFIAAEVEELLARHGIVHLVSPPGTPSYNGSIEAGIGAIKTRAHHAAARADRPGHWTCDDVEWAALEANATARPRGPHGPTPDTIWRGRVRLTPDQRRVFRDTYTELFDEERATSGLLPGVPLPAHQQRALDRVAISRALLRCRFLSIRRRRISPPISRRKSA